MRTHHNANALAAAPSWPALLRYLNPAEEVLFPNSLKTQLWLVGKTAFDLDRAGSGVSESVDFPTQNETFR